jgi:hypothetical protein
MSFANVLIYLALIAYILYGKARGWPMKTPKRLFLLPVLIIIIGYGDATHGTMKPFEVALTVIGGAVSLGLGLLRGRADKISTRDGVQFVQWGGLSFALFAANLVVKLILDVVGVASGSTFSAAEKTLILTLGLTLLGEAIVLFLRSGAGAGRLNSDRSAPARPQAPSGVTPFSDRPEAYRTSESVQQPVWPAGDVRSDRHEHHHDHHEHHHDHHGLTGAS